MSRDEHGMPLPRYAHGPFKVVPNDGDAYQETHLILNGEDNVVCPIYPSDIGEYLVHAANWIVPCREIVRRLAEWAESDLTDDVVPITDDAAKLWESMKGAGDE